MFFFSGEIIFCIFQISNVQKNPFSRKLKHPTWHQSLFLCMCDVIHISQELYFSYSLVKEQWNYFLERPVLSGFGYLFHETTNCSIKRKEYFYCCHTSFAKYIFAIVFIEGRKKQQQKKCTHREFDEYFFLYQTSQVRIVIVLFYFLWLITKFCSLTRQTEEV